MSQQESTAAIFLIRRVIQSTAAALLDITYSKHLWKFFTFENSVLFILKYYQFHFKLPDLSSLKFSHFPKKLISSEASCWQCLGGRSYSATTTQWSVAWYVTAAASSFPRGEKSWSPSRAYSPPPFRLIHYCILD